MAAHMQLFLRYLELNPKNVVIKCKDEIPQTKVKNGEEVTGLLAVCSYLAQQSSNKQHLLGTNPEERACVQQWVEYRQLFVDRCASSQESTNTVLKELNLYLKDRVYFVANTLTLADILIYYSLHPLFATMSFQDKEAYNHVSRWFDLIQHDSGIRQTLPLLVFSKTLLYEKHR
ncbi:eukaryotic translation elongation factor 1 epsilon-1-like [Ornithodoros turicata]